MARTLASNRCARDPADRLLDDDADPARPERRDPDQRVTAEAGQPGALVDDGRLDQVRRDLDARHEVAARDDLAIEGGEDLQRVDPVDAFEVGDPDVEDAVGLGDEIDPALRRATDGQSGSGDGRGETQRRVVLVELAGLGNEDGDRVAGLGRGQRSEIVGAQAPALRPAGPGDGQVTGEDRPSQTRGRASPGVTRWTCTPGRRTISRVERGLPRSHGGCRRRPSRSDSRGRRGCRSRP